MSPAPISSTRLSSSDAVRIRHNLAAVVARYIQDLTRPPATA
ncbi:MAG TPA: hypothetical protein VKV21_15770 [Solirubrobacteraceae bacterium]|nr:hypothetical protein [Solirubrobacteraceae bacterium]